MTYLCENRKMKPERFIFAAWFVCVVALVTAAFCKTVPELAMTQGFLLGLSCLLIEMPSLIILNSWFVKRRGFAYGIIFSFADIWGAMWGYLARYTLGLHGLRFTMLIFAACAVVVPGLFIWSFRSRPLAPDARQDAMSTLSEDIGTGMVVFTSKRRPFYRRPLFYIFLFTTCFQSFAYYIPSIYLPTYNMQVLSRIIDCTSENTNLLAVFNLAQIPGEFLFGWASDRFDVHLLSLVSSLVAGLVTFLLWAGLAGGASATLPALMSFAAIFGAFGAGFLTLWGRMSMSFEASEAGMVYSVLSLVRGISTFASGPISSALLVWGTSLRGLVEEDEGRRGMNSRYVVLIWFVGACMIVAAVVAGMGWVAERMDGVKKEASEDGKTNGCIVEKDTMLEHEAIEDEKKTVFVRVEEI